VILERRRRRREGRGRSARLWDGRIAPAVQRDSERSGMFGRAIKLIQVFGIRVSLDPSWFIIAVLATWSLATGFLPWYTAAWLHRSLPAQMYWILGVAGAMGLFTSILAHEFGHALVARRFGVPVRGITLFIFGGVMEMEEEPPSALAEFWVAVAGPLVSVAIALGAGATLWIGSFFSAPAWLLLLSAALFMFNGMLVLFNLIPAFPLDGGRVLRSILWAWMRDLRKATRISSIIGSGGGVVLIVLGVVRFLNGDYIGGMWWALIGMFLRRAAEMSYEQLLVRRTMEGERVRGFMRTQVQTVDPETTVSDLVEGFIYRHHHKVYPVVRDGRLLGCVSLKRVKELPREEWGTRRVAELIEPCSEANTTRPDADAMATFVKMNRTGKSRLLVTDNGHLDGIVSLGDLSGYIATRLELQKA